mmetsp:Transcript_36617/g.91309  ORF Transcript_36617/g.91309 Transcript_36617/m.91309 type:complete len:380 (+) Transcript_36617:252-1391(+)
MLARSASANLRPAHWTNALPPKIQQRARRGLLEAPRASPRTPSFARKGSASPRRELGGHARLRQRHPCERRAGAGGPSCHRGHGVGGSGRVELAVEHVGHAPQHNVARAEDHHHSEHLAQRLDRGQQVDHAECLRLLHQRLEHVGREEVDHEAVPHEGAPEAHQDKPHHLEAEGIVGEGLEVNHLVELREEVPRENGRAHNSGEEGEEERVVLRDPLHPRAPLVVDEQDGHALRRLNEEDARVEQVGQEGRRPDCHARRHPVAIVRCLLLRGLLHLAQLLAPVEGHDRRQLVGAHHLRGHVDRRAHAVEVDERLAYHAPEYGWVEEAAQGALWVHLLDRRGVREGDRGDHQQPARGDHLPLGAPRALEGERGEDVGADE